MEAAQRAAHIGAARCRQLLQRPNVAPREPVVRVRRLAASSGDLNAPPRRAGAPSWLAGDGLRGLVSRREGRREVAEKLVEARVVVLLSLLEFGLDGLDLRGGGGVGGATAAIADGQSGALGGDKGMRTLA